MAATHGVEFTKKLLFLSRRVYRDLEKGFGQLEVYICTSCGAVEWYCQDPELIPIGPEYMSDVVDFENDAPYR